MSPSPAHSSANATPGLSRLPAPGSANASTALQTPSSPASGLEATKPVEPGTLDGFFNGALPDAIGRSRLNLDVRLRWEHADQAGLKASDAFTVRTRFGLTTAELYGFQGMIEGEDVSVLGDLDNAYYPGETPNGKTTVADPPPRR